MKAVKDYNAQVLKEIFHVEPLADRLKFECKICGRLGCHFYNVRDGHECRSHERDANVNYLGYEGL